MLLALAALTAALYWASMSFAVEFKVPAIRQLLAATEKRESERSREFLQLLKSLQSFRPGRAA